MSKINEKEIKRRLEAVSKFEISHEVTARDLERVNKNLTKLTSEPQESGQNICSIIMKSKISKLAAAAVIIIAVFIAFYRFDSSSIVWADVVRPILTARTLAFNLDMGEGEIPIFKVMNMGMQRLRTEVPSSDGKTLQVIVIVDFDSSQMLTLIPGQKTASLVDLKDLPEKPDNFLEEIRNIITDLQNNPDVSIESLGEQEINGQNAIVFHANGPDEELTIWADPQTALPIRLEQKWHQMQFTGTDFQFDIEMDELLFSMEIPEDYSVLQTNELSFNGSTEQDMIEALRIYAEIILDGVFPKEFIGEGYMKDVMNNREKWLQYTQEQRLELGLKLSQGYIYIQLLKAENDWNYVGNGVKFGDAESPVCWYRPDGSQTYRVIFGDLSIADVEPENLPK